MSEELKYFLAGYVTVQALLFVARYFEWHTP
jgi:hypothetical protein